VQLKDPLCYLDLYVWTSTRVLFSALGTCRGYGEAGLAVAREPEGGGLQNLQVRNVRLDASPPADDFHLQGQLLQAAIRVLG
jgi:hypothetical protein